MKKVLVLTAILLSCVVFNSYAATVTMEEVHNKTCPVSHEEVGKNGMQPHKVVYNGKIYNLCCSMCEKDFNKDPEKYAKIMEAEAAAEKPASVAAPAMKM